MFFSAYLGAGRGFSHWRHTVAGHAHWLGLSARVELRTLTGSDLLGLAWLEHDSRRAERHFCESDHHITVRTFGVAVPGDVPDSAAAVWDALARATDANAIRLTASLPQGELTIVVAPTTPQQLYYARTQDGWVFADDLRLVELLTDAVLDECAVYALLQYGAIPPTLTLYRNVRRAPNGHVLRVRRDSPTVACTPFFRLGDLPRRIEDPEESERAIGETLDAVLAHVPADAVLYFSGGVDSGLMAARLARMGRHDVRLVNYAFDATDPEHVLAVRMAAHLGFTCEVVPHVPRMAADVLDRAARDYAFPFGDISTIPTNVLVHGSLPWIGPSGTVIEGTGADGAYGLAASYPKWRRTYAMPLWVRRQVASAYGRLGLWKFNSRLERFGCIVRKSAGLPLLQAALSQNGLEGLVYDAPEQVQTGLARIVSEHWGVMTDGATAEDRLSLLDLVWVCAGRMAPKSFDPLRTRGIRPLYPFLEPSLVSLSAALPWETKCARGEGKAVLKRMLARDVPAAWVYRRKTGFQRSAHAMFASTTVQAFLHDVVLSPNNPLRAFCRMEVVRRLIDGARSHALGVGTHYFLWALAFTSAWLRRPPEARTQPASDWRPGA